MTTRLQLYNDALLLCGERSLASLSEAREPRYLLDQVWDNGGVGACLERGQWKFAKRTTRIDYDPSITPDYGYRRAFVKPTDWKLTSAVCSDEYFNTPLLQYTDEAGYWYCDLDVIYVQYISDHASYGGDLSTWPASFTDYAASYFAKKIVKTLTSDDATRREVYEIEKNNLLLARSSDAMAGPTQFPAPGNWVNSRQGRTRRDRGSRNNLIG